MNDFLAHDSSDQLLQANVHPSDWTNPIPQGRYNLVVVGAGTAGLVAAAGAAGLGAKVALIERAYLGGDCLNVGCVPSKAVLRAARAVADFRSGKQFGIEMPDVVPITFDAVMARMRQLRATLSPNDSAQRFRNLGVDVYFGAARFTALDRIEVAGQGLHFSKAIIATGARAAAPPIPGLQPVGYLTNENVFNLTELPPRLAVIGAGPIGCELAQAFARFGSQVLLFEAAHGILPREDPDAAEVVKQSLTHDGVQLYCCGKDLKVESTENGTRLMVNSHGLSVDEVVDRILVGTGRAPNVENLGLESANVQYDNSGVTVNRRLQTSNRRIYAAGDICSQYKFTHAADAMARVALQNALFFGRADVTRLIIPWCTYTDPELAQVGMTERQAKDRGIGIRTFLQPLAEVDRAVLDGETNGFLKVHVRGGSDRIVGATIVARHAGDLIAELTAAMTCGLGLKKLARSIHPYPTQSEVVKKACDSYQRTRLTPLVSWLSRQWLSWTR